MDILLWHRLVGIKSGLVELARCCCGSGVSKDKGSSRVAWCAARLVKTVKVSLPIAKWGGIRPSVSTWRSTHVGGPYGGS